MDVWMYGCVDAWMYDDVIMDVWMYGRTYFCTSVA